MVIHAYWVLIKRAIAGQLVNVCPIRRGTVGHVRVLGLVVVSVKRDHCPMALAVKAQNHASLYAVCEACAGCLPTFC